MNVAKPRVLVVDDDPAVAEVVEHVVSRCGLECHVLHRPTGILGAIDFLAPSVVIFDLVMPGLDGVQVLRQLAETDCRANIILLSGADARVLSATAHLGQVHGLKVHAALRKPFCIGELEQAVTAARAPS
jgi:DNA-binding response OmpR family regulator